jgi:hypothetical protein
MHYDTVKYRLKPSSNRALLAPFRGIFLFDYPATRERPMMKAIRCLVLGMAVSALLSCGSLGRAGGAGSARSARERQDSFVERGYEAAYSTRGSDDFEAYIKLRGAPEAMLREPILNPQDKVKDEMVTLRYPGYEMRYLAYSPREFWHPPKSVLMAVLSRAGGKYIFGVEIGMGRERVGNILGLAETKEAEIVLNDAKGRRAILSFERDILTGIVWDYSNE